MTPEGVNMRHPDRVWIGGEWVGAHSGRTIEIVSPIREEVIGAVAEADAEDMDAAVAAARAAFDAGPWAGSPPAERIAFLKRMAQHLHARTAEIARAWTRADGRARELRADDRGLHRPSSRSSPPRRPSRSSRPGHRRS